MSIEDKMTLARIVMKINKVEGLLVDKQGMLEQVYNHLSEAAKILTELSEDFPTKWMVVKLQIMAVAVEALCGKKN